MPGDKESNTPLDRLSPSSSTETSTDSTDNSSTFTHSATTRTYSTLETNLAEQLLVLKDGLSVDNELATNADTQRKKRKFVAEEQKDEVYWERRKKNNDAAKRSREKRRLNDTIMGSKIEEVSRENANLRAELNQLKSQISNNGPRQSRLLSAVRDPYRANMSETAGYPLPGTSRNSVKGPTADMVYGQIPHNNRLTPPVTTREPVGVTPPHVGPIVLPISSSAAHLPFVAGLPYVTVPQIPINSVVPRMSVLIPGSAGLNHHHNTIPHLDVLLKKEPDDHADSEPSAKLSDEGFGGENVQPPESEYAHSDVSDISDESSGSPRRSDLFISVGLPFERPRSRKRSADPETVNPKYADAKYADRRRKNNAAARKCRETRKEITRLRAVRSNMLEAENAKLRQEIHGLTVEIHYLKELLEKKTAIERENGSQ